MPEEIGKYSVLMSVYEKEKADFFRQSIESMIRQSLPPSDFVLVCDGKLNEELDAVITWAQCELGEKLQCIRLPRNKGLGNALRVGLEKCRYSIVARMDSDDISRKQRCQFQVETMEQGGYDIVGGVLEEFNVTPGDSGKVRIVPERPEEILKYAGKRNPFNHPCVMFRKEAVIKAGGYQDFPWFEDYYLWVRMLQQGCRGYNLSQILLDMRAGKNMYKRRGGFAYLKSIVRFQKYLKQQKMINGLEFFVNCTVRCLIGIVPGRIREQFYQFALRKKAKNRHEKVG